MTCLHISLSKGKGDYLAAASRIHDALTVDIGGQPDAVVTDDNSFQSNGTPVLLVNATPLHEEPWLFPALPWRFAPDIRAIVDSLRAGELGQPGLMCLHDWASYSRSKGDASQLGAVDLACWLFDNEPDSIYGVSSKINSQACSLIHLGFSGGGMAMLDFTDAPIGGQGYRSLCLIGSRGEAYADDHHNRNLFFSGGSAEACSPDFGRAFIQPMLEDFITSVRKGVDSGGATKSYGTALKIVTAAMANRTDI